MTAIREPLFGSAAAEVVARLTATPMHRLDVPTAAVEADIVLQSLLAAPPHGHTAVLQPAHWYERVFDQMACAHPNTCACTPEETP